MSGPEKRRLSGRAKFLVDFGPLAVFFIAYFFGRPLASVAGGFVGRDWSIPEGEEIYLAMGAFMPVFAVVFVYSVVKERRVAPMLGVSGAVIAVLGGLAFILHDRTFIFLKPTIVYSLFAVALAAGLATGRNFLKTLFDGALHMEDAAWRILTKRFAGCFAVLALANEVAWRYLMRDCDFTAEARCPGEPAWVNLKVWGFTGAYLAFCVAQAPFLAKHSRQGPQSPSIGLE
ncbi:MAG: septation protein IspZ [Parvularculaceae bacterium]|jgi:intracellular septation protein|nr:septation protein IspZ [Parvularculaceae bacterium]